MRTFFSKCAGIVVIIIVTLVVLGFIFWSRIPDSIAHQLSQKLGVSVHIEDIGLRWDKIKVERIEIGNTPKSILSKAFSCQLITITAPIRRYFEHNILIDEIVLDHVYLGLEFDSATSTRGNWTEIMQHLQNTTQVGSKEAPSPKRRLLIRQLVLKNIDVDVFYRTGKGKVQRLPHIQQIELHDISSEEGLPLDQIMRSVLGQMLKSVFEKENLKNMLQELLQQPGNNVQKFLNPFKGIFNTLPIPVPTETTTFETRLIYTKSISKSCCLEKLSAPAFPRLQAA